MDAAEKFFYDHAGFSHNPLTETPEAGRLRTAMELADAENAALALGWWITVENDPDVMDDDADSVGMVARGEAVNLVVTLHGTSPVRSDTTLVNRVPQVLGSISGVVVPNGDDPYLRVVAAELALEAQRY